MGNQKLKIVQVIDTLNVGGGERVFVDMCNILKENHEKVEVLYLLTPGALHFELNTKIKFTALNRKNKLSFSKMYECSLLLKQNDIIHCHFRHVYNYITLVSLIFRVKTKIILHDHYGSIDVNKKVPIMFKGFFKPKTYIGVSNSLTDWAINYLNINKKNVFILPNLIVKTINFQKLSCQKDLILVSNIKTIKNNQFAIDIIEKSQFSLLIIGKNQEDNYFKNLLNRATNLGIEINQNVEKTQPILLNFKLGLHTSISESGPLVLIEYLAQGLPFLAYETGEVAKILKPYFPEYFIDNFNVEEWIKRIEKLLNSTKNSKLMEEVFEKHFSQTQYYQKLKDIYYA